MVSTISAKSRALMVLLHTLLWFAVVSFDPFEMESASDRASIDAFQRIYSLFYPTSHQNEITVIVINDKFLPLSQQGSTYIFDGLAKSGAQPRAIFVDLLFDRRRENDLTVEKLCSALRRLSEQGVPLFFARLEAVPDTIPNSRRIEEDLPTDVFLRSTCGDDIVRPALVEWSAERGDYPLLLTGDKTPPAAVALYLESSQPNSQLKNRLLSAHNKEVNNDAFFSIIWGGRPPVLADDCSPDLYRRSVLQRVASIGRIAIMGLGLSEEAAKQYRQPQPCLFHEVIDARELAIADDITLVGISEILDGDFTLALNVGRAGFQGDNVFLA